MGNFHKDNSKTLVYISIKIIIPMYLENLIVINVFKKYQLDKAILQNKLVLILV